MGFVRLSEQVFFCVSLLLQLGDREDEGVVVRERVSASFQFLSFSFSTFLLNLLGSLVRSSQVCAAVVDSNSATRMLVFSIRLCEVYGLCVSLTTWSNVKT